MDNPSPHAAAELARLDKMRAGLWTAAQLGDTKAVDAVMRIDFRSAALLAQRTEGAMFLSVQTAVTQMDWVKAEDQAAVDLALTYAARIDEALLYGEGQEITKALYLGPHLLNTLRALEGTPDSRKSAPPSEAIGGKLAQLRKIQGGRTA